MKIKNRVFSNWTVVDSRVSVNTKDKVFCKCVCGLFRLVLYGNLLTGKSKGCGTRCLGSKVLKESHELYSTWKSMKSRCNNPNTKAYKNYGARGIKVCEEWSKDFYKFVEDMYPTYLKGLTLERKDPNEGYFKNNCRWATPAEQSRNTRRNIYLPYKGKYYTEADLSKILNIPRTTLQARRRSGWCVEDIINGKKK